MRRLPTTSQGRLLALLLVAIPATASAQDSRPAPKGPWWDTPKARDEAARVLKAVPPLIQGTERGDGSHALRLLRDDNWILRRLAVVRLQAMGLTGTAVGKLKLHGLPASQPPGTNTKHYRAAKQFVEAMQVEPRGVAPIGIGEACRVVTGVVDVQIRGGSDVIATKLRLVSGLLSYRVCLRKKKDRAWLAETILSLTDEDRILTDLGFSTKTRKKALERGGRKVFRWYRSNVDYLYWHPYDKRFRLDVKARSAKTPTASYRAKHPWKRGEGPLRIGAKRRQQ